MFTGLVQGLGTIGGLARRAEGLVLEIDCPDGPGDWTAIEEGESIAVNGACLTVTAVTGRRVRFDVVPETVRRTALGGLSAGDRVNLERSIAAGERFGGHYVLGHVDGIGTVAARREAGGEIRFQVDAGPDWIRWIIPKGSIAVDGVSLTVTEVEGTRFGFAVVPWTLERTTLGRRRPGDRVHLECDHFGKWIVQAARMFLAGAPPRDLWDALRRGGFMEGDDA